MSTTSLDLSSEIRESVIAKLHPRRIKVSSKFTAILGALVGEAWTQPRIVAICSTGDGILAMEEGDIGYNHFIAAPADLERNLDGVARVAELTDAELSWLKAQVKVAGFNS